LRKAAGGVVVTMAAIGAAAHALGAARDEHLRFPIQAALEKSQSYRTKIEYDVRLFFGKQKLPRVAKRMTTVSANTKSNAVGKPDQEACDIAFLSALADLQQRARRAGGNAVVDIKSTYRGENLDSPSDYVCGAGTIMVGVTLEGTVVRLE
jgi:uncharacterized protein YbjQ (UPF0145 family)